MKFSSTIILFVLLFSHQAAAANISENPKENQAITPGSELSKVSSILIEKSNRMKRNESNLNLLGYNHIEISGDIYARDEVLRTVIYSIVNDNTELYIEGTCFYRDEVVDLIYHSFSKEKYFDVHKIDFNDCLECLQHFYGHDFQEDLTYELGQLVIFEGLDLDSKVKEFRKNHKKNSKLRVVTNLAETISIN